MQRFARDQFPHCQNFNSKSREKKIPRVALKQTDVLYKSKLHRIIINHEQSKGNNGGLFSFATLNTKNKWLLIPVRYSENTYSSSLTPQVRRVHLSSHK